MNSYTRYYKCPPLSLSLSNTHTLTHRRTTLIFIIFSTLFSFCHHCLDTWAQNPKQTPHVHCIWTGVYSLIISYAIVFFGYIFLHYLRLLIFDHLILLASFHSLSLQALDCLYPPSSAWPLPFLEHIRHPVLWAFALSYLLCLECSFAIYLIN